MFAQEPMEVIGIDLMGPFCQSTEGCFYIGSITDMASRYAWSVALKTKTQAELFIYLQNQLLLIYGTPGIILSDQAYLDRLPEFFMATHGIDQRVTTAYRPQTNGLTERFNQTLCDMLAKLMGPTGPHTSWPDLLPLATFLYNISILHWLRHRSTHSLAVNRAR